MGLDIIVNQILTARTDLKTEQIFEMIKNKKKETGNFLTDQTAARIIASELGVKISKKQFSLKIQIKDIVSGLNDVSLNVQVVTSYPSRTFKRRDWTEGKIGSIIVSDKTGTIRVVLWDDKAELLDKGKIQKEQKINVSHAYVRQGQDGKPELHLGDKGRIKVLDQATKKLAEITEEGGPITVEGTVTTKPVFREVTTARNEKIAVANFELTDKSSTIRVSAWRNLAQTVKDLPEGVRIKIRNVYARRGYENRMELSSRYSTVIETLN
ncbi:MAG: OB-fold nucleic acid binding domain-containing protein [Candidatus Bathyarchaeota archaeon]|nr:OB-fold nucleic acid binding domain-containing protein [Candidatus Bathyarchaeum tardum]WGM89692.1 MAG: OB-fold nucleic acid binding domain-containing protein [Candidatus Bathyarchaeum tardum]